MKFSLFLRIFMGFSLIVSVSAEAIEYRQLSPSSVMYTSTMSLEGGEPFPLNGVIAFARRKAVVIDLPVNDKDTHELFDWVEKQGRQVAYVVPLHWHKDSTGGMQAALERGAKVIMYEKTRELLAAEGRVYPAQIFHVRHGLRIDNVNIEFAHLGAGHSLDSVVAWFPEEKILVGGCLIKAIDAKNLGFVGDADLNAYPLTLKTIMDVYKDAKLVIPGHGEPGGLNLVDHTLKLLQQGQSN